MNLKFYGGVQEIGGNKILLEDDDTKVFLDFGMSFSRYGRFFEEYLKPRVSCGMADFVAAGLVPEIPGIYRQDLLRLLGWPIHDEPAVDAVVVSHMHLDHAAYVSFLDEDIPVLCSEISKRIAKVLLEAGTRQIDKEIYNFKCRPIVDRGDEPIDRKFCVLEHQTPVKIQSIELHPFSVCHSIPGSLAFVIYCPNGIIVYTGDLRLRGPNGELTEQFIENAGGDRPDVLLCEGTRIDSTDSRTEDDVRTDASEIITRLKGLAIADFAERDIERLRTFYRVALEHGRKFVISKRDAYLLQELAGAGLDLPQLASDDLYVYVDRRGTGRYVDSDYYAWERPFLRLPNSVKSEFINRNQDELVMHLGFFDISELLDIKPEEGSAYLHSTSEPHNEEQRLDEERLNNWLSFLKIPRFHVHASGHANAFDLMHIIEGIKPKTLVPIHTERPELFKLMHENVQYPQLTIP